MSSPEGVDDRREGGGYGHRAERRSARRLKRRRRRTKRLFVASLPMLVVVFGVVALLIILGGRATDSSASVTTPPTTSTAASPEAQPAVLVVIAQDDTVPVIVLLASRQGGGTAMGLPGPTLVKTDQGFETVGNLYAGGKSAALVAGLSSDLAIEVRSVAMLQWTALVAALETAGGGGSWPGSLTADAAGSLTGAEALLSLAVASNAAAGDSVWGGVELSGDADSLRSFVRQAAETLGSDGWTKASLPGRTVEGIDFSYFESDVQAAKAILRGESQPQQMGTAITLEVQNGSGEIDAAQSAGDLLQSLGYEMLPYANAEGFPDVAETMIHAPSELTAQAEKIKNLLGVGTVITDNSLPGGRIRVVVGQDFPPAAAN